MDVSYSCKAVRQVKLSGVLERMDDISRLLHFFEKISEVRFDIDGRKIFVKEKE